MQIEVNRSERDSILDLFLSVNPNESNLNPSCYNFLETLKLAAIVSESIQKNVIGFQSKIDIKTSFGSKEGITLVMPSEENIELSRYSVLSQLGMLLFGKKQGDIVFWEHHDTKEQIEIISVK
jgi:transcription elongation GreA/GreB family factor